MTSHEERVERMLNKHGNHATKEDKILEKLDKIETQVLALRHELNELKGVDNGNLYQRDNS